MDKLFDILNSRSPVGRGFKSSLSVSNLQSRKEFLVDMRDYLLRISMLDGLPLFKTPRGTCIQGFVTQIDSLLGLAEDLHEQEFICSYKLSQDHIELFFNAIRRASGWNNNPTAVTFTSVFRKIISHCGALQVSSSGNCQALDNTEIIQLSMSTYRPPVVAEESNELDPFIAEQLAIHDHCYSSDKLSPLVENVIVYVAGWVVRKMFRVLACTTCRLSLVTDTPSEQYKGSYTLLELKQNGGLIMPSVDCIKVVMSAEKHLRRISDVNHIDRHLTVLRLQKNVTADVGNQVFVNDVHMLESQDGIDNHSFSLIKSIVQIFYNMRQYHIAKMHNITSHGRSVRHTLTKTILFKGQ